jgi:DNA invertase Pin-like site-specific DNA recombinase
MMKTTNTTDRTKTLPPWLKSPTQNQKKAVAYYRHSAQDRQENSIAIQSEQVRQFATEHNLEIIHEFSDKGISGLSVEGRHAFNEMLNDYVIGGMAEFDYVLVLDVSRWGRFQETDLSAYYTGLCAKYGKQVVYTTIGFPKDDGLLHGLHLSIERYRAASYSRELSVKVFKGCAKIASDGYWAGGSPPYGTQRLLLDEQRNPVRVLRPGEHKAIHNQRVILTLGEQHEVAAIQQIFDSFVNTGKDPEEIAADLCDAGIPSPGGGRWRKSGVSSVLKNPLYAGVMVWNKTSQKMKSPSRKNPRDEWILHPNAFEPIVPQEVFDLAQEIIHAKEEVRLRRYSDEDMIEKLRGIHDKYGFVSGKLIAATHDALSPATYVSHFSSLDLAYQSMFTDEIAKRVAEVLDVLHETGAVIRLFDDVIVVDEAFSVRVEPVIPIRTGFEVYWPFHPHLRSEIDLTIGVPLSAPDEFEVLAYLALPRVMFRQKLRLCSSNPQVFDLYTCRLPEFIDNMRR